MNKLKKTLYIFIKENFCELGLKIQIALIITIIWTLLGATLALYEYLSPFRELNELGDFLSGWFSPLAFLWLILAFFLQKEELRASTTALKLQADELKSTSSAAQKSINHAIQRDISLTIQDKLDAIASNIDKKYSYTAGPEHSTQELKTLISAVSSLGSKEFPIEQKLITHKIDEIQQGYTPIKTISDLYSILIEINEPIKAYIHHNSTDEQIMVTFEKELNSYERSTLIKSSLIAEIICSPNPKNLEYNPYLKPLGLIM